jgi:outer membrane protein, heavy metal efflux system
MMKTIFLYLMTVVAVTTVDAQASLDSVLKAVRVNNKAIQSNQKYWEARKAEFKTGLTPYDPQVEYDYLFGSPAGAGNQRDFSVTQRFDFPRVYKQKKALSKEQWLQGDLQHVVYRQDVLLEAKLAVLEFIYLNKKAAVLERRKSKVNRLVQDYQNKLELGEVIILDVNKARLQLLNIQNEVALNDNEREAAITRLNELNGGYSIVVRDTIYPIAPTVPDFETLDSIIEANDPLLKTYEQEKVILQRQVAVQKTLNLPKIETGYHSQGILGQSYKGVHAGVTVPLWENKNKVRAAEANLDYATANAETHRLEHRLENKRIYDQLAVRLKAMRDYQELVATLNNNSLLEKALRLGQITVIQYFQDENYYFATYDQYLKMELEYQKAVARLYKFEL